MAMEIPDRAEADEPLAGLSLPRLHHIVYCSRAVAGVDNAAVSHIVQTAQRNNGQSFWIIGWKEVADGSMVRMCQYSAWIGQISTMHEA